MYFLKEKLIYFLLNHFFFAKELNMSYILAMNRIIASLLILMIFSMHSAWAISVHSDSEHDIDLSSHIKSGYQDAIDNTTLSDGDEGCDEHHCHLSSHATGLFSLFSLTVNPIQQSIDTTVILSDYLHSQATPQRPPKA